VVLISAHVDVPMAVRAMKAGAIDVLTKPIREQDLLEAVNRALANDSARRNALNPLCPAFETFQAYRS